MNTFSTVPFMESILPLNKTFNKIKHNPYTIHNINNPDVIHVVQDNTFLVLFGCTVRVFEDEKFKHYYCNVNVKSTELDPKDLYAIGFYEIVQKMFLKNYVNTTFNKEYEKMFGYDPDDRWDGEVINDIKNHKYRVLSDLFYIFEALDE